jgi:hypothetical protein
MVKHWWLASLTLWLIAGCAKVWGFDDLTGNPYAVGGTTSYVGGSGSGGGECMPNYRLCDDKCGEIVNNCGTVSRCDDCTAPQVCGGNKLSNVCGDDACVPSCEGKACGESNGCSGICAHGSCADGEYCAGRACVANDVCGVNAPCPMNDCAGCRLYCSAEGRCCVQDYGCTSNGDCCQGSFCDRDRGESVGTCRVASAGQACSEDISCSFVGGETAGDCKDGKCCAFLASYCSDANGCCDGLSCASGKCCVASQKACSVTKDCCDPKAVCQGDLCCIASGSPGCTSNADCCAGSLGCVAGSCK